jgi:ABC-type Mn2+/Zn2+ transport system permease subunit
MRFLIENLYALWPALLAAGALGIAGAIVGVFVLLRRETLLALALPQVVTLGAAIAMRLGWPALPPVVACVAASTGWVAWSRRCGLGHAALPVVYLSGVAVAVLIVANAAAHLIEVQNMFSGIDVAVAPFEAIVATIVLGITSAACAVQWRRWLLLAQSAALAEIAGLRPARWDALFLILLAVVSVVGTSTSGAVMTIAMMFLPGAIVLPLARRIPVALVCASLAAISMIVVGFVASVEKQRPLSHSVGAAGVSAAITSQAIAGLRSRAALA